MIKERLVPVGDVLEIQGYIADTCDYLKHIENTLDDLEKEVNK